MAGRGRCFPRLRQQRGTSRVDLDVSHPRYWVSLLSGGMTGLHDRSEARRGWGLHRHASRRNKGSRGGSPPGPHFAPLERWRPTTILNGVGPDREPRHRPEAVLPAQDEHRRGMPSALDVIATRRSGQRWSGLHQLSLGSCTTRLLGTADSSLGKGDVFEQVGGRTRESSRRCEGVSPSSRDVEGSSSGWRPAEHTAIYLRRSPTSSSTRQGAPLVSAERSTDYVLRAWRRASIGRCG